MKLILHFFGVVFLFAFIAPLRADLVLQPNDMVAMCGDSITEQKIYTVYLEDYFLMCQPVAGLRAAEFGGGGATAASFQFTQIEPNVLPFKPTVVTSFFGMNDGGYAPMTDATGDGYRKNLTAAITKLKAGGVRAILLASPGCVDPAAFHNPQTSADVYNQTLGALRDVAKDLAQKEGVGFADVHTPMMEVMAKAKAAYGDKYQFVSGGGIHPGNNGHIVIAYALLKGLGCDGAIGTITVDLAGNAATGTPGQKILACQNGAVQVESTRYPFCFQGEPDKPEPTDASVIHFFPFNDELNRYLLVVKGLKSSKAKVTWGPASKEFSAADLAKGVNLAAEFLVNPFCDQFNKVHVAVQAQQAQEAVLVKDFLHNVPEFRTMAPHTNAELDQVVADGMAQEKSLFLAAQALVVPIQHTITIIPES